MSQIFLSQMLRLMCDTVCLLQASVVFLLEACLAEVNNAAMAFDGDQVLDLEDEAAMVAFVYVVFSGMEAFLFRHAVFADVELGFVQIFV